MYSKIWGQVIDKLCATVKKICVLSDAANRFDDIGLFSLTEIAMFNIQIK